jgi:hypothetical protein
MTTGKGVFQPGTRRQQALICEESSLLSMITHREERWDRLGQVIRENWLEREKDLPG